jgi:uncharacterized OB-fold protein
MSKNRVPAVEGMFRMDFDNPQLIGGRSKATGSYYFPKELSGSDPLAEGNTDREEVMLSTEGTIWSYTTASYPPALPYQIIEPFEPFIVCAVELEKEQIVVCGQMMPGIEIDDIDVGTKVKLALDVVYEDDEAEHIVWKWDLV